MIMNLWGDKAGPPMSATHFGFGVGAIIAPQLAKNFLSPDAAENGDGDIISTVSTNVTTDIDDGEIEIPYTIVSALTVILGLLMFGFFIKGPPKGISEIKGSKLSLEVLLKMLSPSSCTSGDTIFGIVLFVLLFLYFIHAAGGEGAMSEYNNTLMFHCERTDGQVFLFVCLHTGFNNILSNLISKCFYTLQVNTCFPLPWKVIYNSQKMMQLTCNPCFGFAT